MQQEYSIVIADTSCFILLSKINEIEVLHQIFSTVVTTKEIAEEFGKPLPAWVSINIVENKNYQKILETEIDKGEASALALAMEEKKSLLILDDLKERKFAEKLHLNYTETLGVSLKAKEKGVFKNIKPILQKIQTSNFRFSEKGYCDILKEANE